MLGRAGASGAAWKSERRRLKQKGREVHRRFKFARSSINNHCLPEPGLPFYHSINEVTEGFASKDSSIPCFNSAQNGAARAPLFQQRVCAHASVHRTRKC